MTSMLPFLGIVVDPGGPEDVDALGVLGGEGPQANLVVVFDLLDLAGSLGAHQVDLQAFPQDDPHFPHIGVAILVDGRQAGPVLLGVGLIQDAFDFLPYIGPGGRVQADFHDSSLVLKIFS
jgi:hypothetical protein